MRSAILALLTFAIAAAAHADEGAPAVPVPPLPLYQQECAACHLAYPPELLPRQSWSRLMNGLPRHFGADASLDAAAVQEIDRWLQAHASDARRSRRGPAMPPPEDRITRSAWFVHEHDELVAGVWARPTVNSPANCAACHTRADQGDFSERHVRIPR